MTASPAPDPATLVGRERELVTLRDALANVLAGGGSLVLIGGEAGLGKTTLAEAVCAEATALGALVLVGRCYDLAETPPYGPWIEALARAPGGDGLPALPATLLPGEHAGEALGSQDAILRRAQAYLAALAARQPVLLLLEDLHWADPASTDLLRVVARGLAELPLLLLATYRADEVVRRHPLYALLPTLVREARARRIDLRPLDTAGLLALVASRYALTDAETARLVAYLWERTEGNPFFADEVLRSLEEGDALRRAGAGWALADLAALGVPPLLRQVIDARLDRLGDDARGALAVAAVLGQEVPLALWLAVVGVSEDTLLDLVERAGEARVLLPTAAGVRFAHALIRETLYEGVLPLRRRALHRRVADALSALPLPDPDAVAYHLQRAHDPRAAAWLVRAGERAWRAYAWLTAAERYETALALTDHGGLDAGERALLLLTLAQLWRYEDRHRGAGYVEEAERLAAAAGDAALVAAARFDAGHLRLLADDAHAASDRAAGLAAMAAALPALEALPPADRARLPAPLLQGVRGDELYHRGALMYWLASVGRLAEAMALGAPMVARGPGSTARGLAALGVAYFHLGQPEEAERALADAQEAFRVAGQQFEVYYRLLDRLRVARVYHLDAPARWQHLAAAVDETVRRAAGAGQLDRTIPALEILVVRGDWGEARERDPRFAGESWARATVARYQGDATTAGATIDRYLPRGPATEPGGHGLQGVLPFQQLASALALDAGDLPTAHAWLAAHDRWLAWSGSVWGQAEGHLGWAAYHRAAGNPAAAHARATRALAHATEPRQPLALLAARRTLGELDTAEGRHADAAAHLTEALALAEACAAPYEHALTQLALAALHLAADDRDRGQSALAEACALLGPLEAAPALARADALAARLAAHAPPPALPFGLTAREAEVLALLVEGLTDVQIGERLFVSRNTVNTHTRAIYGKLGVTSRAAATRIAMEHGLR